MILNPCLEDGHISKEDEMQKLPFVIALKLIAIGE